MGFEQLAGLKQQLEAQRQKEEAQRQKEKKPSATKRTTQRQAPKPAAAPATPVDPVVIAISRLQRQFPAAFPKRPAPKLPLKLGVHKDLVEQSAVLGLTPEQIKEAVKTWCEGTRYWTCVAQGAPRIDLSGAPNGEVTASEAQRARYLMSRRRKRPASGGAKPGDKPAANTAASTAQAHDATAPDTVSDEVKAAEDKA